MNVKANDKKMRSQADFHGRRALDLAREFLSRREIDKALAAYDRAEHFGCDPDECGGGRWTCWMLKGDFRSAWRESAAWMARGGSDSNRLWNGRGWQGKSVIIRCLHGFGDTIQFIRYAPMLRSQARSLTVEVHPEMVSLLQNVPGIDRVVSWDATPCLGKSSSK